MLRDQVRAVMAAVFSVPVDAIAEDASPETIASWESVTHMNLVLALEEEFGVQFTDEQLVQMQSLPAILQQLKEAGVDA